MTLNVRDFGARGDGVADDSSAIQAAIDAATGTNDPAAGSRYPSAPLYLPTGTYRCTRTLRIRSVQGFYLFGDGPEATVLRAASEVNLDSLLEIDGAANGIFSRFGLQTSATGSEYVDKMLFLRWSPAAARSTSNNNFQNVNIGGGRFRTAFAIGTDDGTRQCDGSIFQDCLVTGDVTQQWDLADVNLCQNGWEIGDGTHGNNIDHYLYGCSWASVRVGIRLNASNAFVYGSQPGGSLVDVLITGSAHPTVIDGMRSEQSQKLLEHGGGAADSHVTLRNINWNAVGMQASDTRWIRHNTSGALYLENVVCENEPTGLVPTISIDSAGGNPVSCMANCVASSSPVEQAFSLGPGASLVVANYHQRNPDTTIAKITSFRVIRENHVQLEA